MRYRSVPIAVMAALFAAGLFAVTPAVPAYAAADAATLDAGTVHPPVDAGLAAAALDAVALQEPDEQEEEDDGDDLPLEVGRVLDLTLNEGSWLSLDVSPDGQTIVFELLGDLYTLPIDGGRATQITDGMAFDAQPRFSPDGERIVFTSDRDGGENVWVMALDGSDTTQITRGGNNRFTSPEFTPDGDYIVVSEGGSAKPWLYHVDGGTGIQLVEEPGNLKLTGAAFGPDPRHIWFAQRSGDWQYNAQYPQYQLTVYDRETGELYRRSGRYGSGLRPTLSPDGRWLVYGTRYDGETGLRIRDLETGDESWFLYPIQRDDQESRGTRDVLPAMSFTPDSRGFVLSYGGKIWNVPVGEGGSAGTPREVPFTVETALELGPLVEFEYEFDDAETFEASQIRDLAVSPDGRMMAFTALDQLWVTELADDGTPTGSPERIVEIDAANQHPAWSPDGEWIVFAAWGVDGGHLYRVRPDGDDLEQLTTTAAVYREPAWSPDGERIVAVQMQRQAFRDASSYGGDLIWLPADGGEITRIAPTDGRSRPHFTRDNADRIYLDGDGLVSIRWDGTDEKQHIDISGASDIMISPDGSLALAQVSRDVYVTTIPYVGGEAPEIDVENPSRAAVPSWRLTDVGGEFPTWDGSGRRVHFALGAAHFVYDMDEAEAAERTAEASDADDDEDEEDDEGYEPLETRVRVVVQRDIPQGVAVLRGARVITMRGDEVIENADLVVRNHRIAAVGRRGQVDVPANAEVIDVSGATIVPGYVDTHAHLRVGRGFHVNQAWAYLANLAYGVTTTRDPQTGTTDVLSYADRVEAGTLLGPRVYSTGPGVFSRDDIEDLDHARTFLRRYSEYFDTKTIKQYVAGNREQRQWIIQAARELELMPTTEGSLDLKLNLTHMIDGYSGHEHTFPIFPLYDDVVQLTAQSRTVYTPTILVAYGAPWVENYFFSRESPHDDPKLQRFTPHAELDELTLRRGQWFHDQEHDLEGIAEFVTKLVEAGGRAGVGSHGQLQGLGYHWELWAMAAADLDEHDALRVATQFGAEAVGYGNDLGSIEAGKIADLVVLNSNPLDDLRATNDIRYVMKNGRLYEGDTLNEIYPRQRPLDRQWWWEAEPAPITAASASDGQEDDR